MSYRGYHRPRRFVRTRGMGDIYQMAGGSSLEKQCLDRANGTPQVRAIDQQIDQLGKTWNPTGYFRPADLQALLDTLATEAEAAGAALAAAPRSTSDATAMINQAFADLIRRYRDRSYAYSNAVAQARAMAANVVDAPGLKDFVLSSMRAISDAYVTATVMQCMQSWLEKWLDRAYKAMATIGAVAYRIIGVAINAGEKIVKAVDDAFDLLKYAKYGLVAVGALFVYREFRRSRA